MNPAENAEESPSAALSEQQGTPSVPIPEEFIRQLPKEQQDAMRSFFSGSFAQITTPPQHPLTPLIEKFNEGHLTQMIGNEDKADTSRRRFQFAYFLVCIVAVGSLIGGVLAFTDRELLMPLITACGTFLGGTGVGGIILSRMRQT